MSDALCLSLLAQCTTAHAHFFAVVIFVIEKLNTSFGVLRLSVVGANFDIIFGTSSEMVCMHIQFSVYFHFHKLLLMR